MKILVLADTHNRLPANMSALANGVNEIWHLGDVCDEAILDELRALGPPVTLVRGNCDAENTWPLVVDLTRHGTRFRLQHIPPGAREQSATDVFLHGHTHVPRHERVGKILFLNPGCVTRPNRGAPASVAYLEIDERGKIAWRTQLLR
ncbi:MAG: YfcE family phosphodiesterase [Verrucomicrobiota bacterium]|nr:YfcE family phosphodiesterase [Verrucomicrobiota bacterium]